MRVHVYEQLMAMQASRRHLMKGAAGAAAALATSSPLSLATSPAYAQDSVVAQIMKIPGAGNGSPTDADWQKVGELCLGPTKQYVQPGEFKGVNFSFMGLNNQNLHNFLFRGFLKPWEAYTGASIKWIDLAQADYNARLQQSIATGTVDFDIIEMGAPFEGDMGVKDLLSEMPDWVMKQIDFDDIVNYLKPPVGTWNGKIHRTTIDSDCHTMNRRTDVFTDADLGKQWADWKDKAGLTDVGSAEDLAAGPADHQVPQGQEVQGQGGLRLPRPAEALGRVPVLFHREPCHGLRQISGRKELDVRREHEAARQQPRLGARDSGRRRRPALRARRPDQRRSGHDGLPAVPDRHRLAARMVGRHRHRRQDQRYGDDRRRARLRHPSGFGRCLQLPQGRSGRSWRAGPTLRRTWPISAGASM